MRCLSSPGTTVPLLLYNLIAVSMIVPAVECPHLVSVCSSVPVTGQSIQLSGSGNLLWGRGWFGWLGRFEFFLSRPLLTLLFSNPLPVFQVPLPLSFFHLFRISIGHSRWQLTSGLDAGLYLDIFPPISDLVPGSAEMGKICTHGGHPPQSSSCRINPSLDSHLTLT